jgi:hypothetical protein
MCIFSEYKDILGVSREGIHSIRVFDYAIIDILMTLIGAIVISYIFKFNLILTFIYLFILGQFLHILFCVETKFISLFLNLKNNHINNKN